MNENALIPDKVGKLPEGPWLIFAPHADDETFGMGGSILLAVAAKIEVNIVILTNGSQADSKLEKEQLVKAREEEAKQVCLELGVTECQFWRQPDRQLRSSNELISKAKSLIKTKKPKTVFAPSVLEFHPDHRATADLVWRALQEPFDASDSTPLLALYDITTLGPCNLLTDISTVKDRKRSIMKLYLSQVKEHGYINLVESLNVARSLSVAPNVKAAESFFVLTPSHYATLKQAVKPWFDRHFQPIEHDQPLVSVILRTQGRPEITQALKSINHQSYDNIEVVIINDGGENVQPNLSELQHSFAALNCIANDTARGRATAANQGMAACKGDYFLFLDDDDWLDANHIAKLVAAQQETDSLVTYTGVRAVRVVDNRLVTERVFDDKFDRNRLFYENFIPINAALIDRRVIDDGLRMDTDFDVFEDWDFWLQLCQLTIEFKHVPGVSAQYRISDSQGIGIHGEHKQARRRLISRWAKTWGVDELDDLMTRLHLWSKLKP